ncbi:pyridine nucleotide-disulfide oxidoreductase-domain-containing protein [Halteromyces radiatus]|uniref:pyridine nucleotide-disulfide oxidoreductase-domain-containing protein n=1 Tax=Halteromyces radiatus TaxID=101107 RepID=UPI002220FF4D|nr:pyridine nucleotide-disulfide oxidoreductase-domain-containing protein [Halteromyces radiatus]KAI8100100.1 pyridine nucleotide-disulfide oxidoreductase-domain-containing protein [Halteromyces radiatus]
MRSTLSIQPFLRIQSLHRSSIIVHTRKQFQTITSSKTTIPKRSGWAGYKLMRELDRKKFDVMVVSPSTSVGSLEFRCVTEPVRGYSKDIDYYQATCDDIDVESKVIHCTSQVPETKKTTFSLEYDILVISVGSYSNTFGIPGVKEHALFLRDVDHARSIRKRLIECFEYASQPGLTETQKRNRLHFVVAGAGPTGIEFSAELYDFISRDASRLYPELIRFISMTLYDVAPHILNGFDSDLSSYAHQHFDRKGIRIKTQRFVESVMEDKLIIRNEGEVPYGLLVWSTGLCENPLVTKLDVAKDDRKQRILTNSHLQVLDKSHIPYPDLFAIGDCATMKNQDLPLTAQVATQKAMYLSKVLNGNGSIQEFEFRNRGMMAYIGGSEALVDMSSVHQGAKNSGRLAWLLWRSAYFSMSMSIRNRLLIPHYWLLTWIFGRDITRF